MSAKPREIDVIGGSVVLIGHGLLTQIPALLREPKLAIKASKFVVVSDKTVFALYGQQLLDAFEAAGVSAISYVIEPGESSKDRLVKERIEDFMLEQRCQRDTCMVALGGGVVGDLTGFVAATFMRGVPVVQIPTSMMAMLDSSVGGKTAINVPAGKNLIGAFHQPRRVFADIDLLKSLGQREISEGLAEAIKMGCIRSAPLFDLLETRVDEVRALEHDVISQVVYESVRLKAEVVALDEKEAGLRSTLNFGHTIGHAIEGLASPQMLHGECVSIGCVLEATLARDLGHLAPSAVGRILRVMKAYALPVECPPKYLVLPKLMKKMAVDKKNAAGVIRCTILTGIGSCFEHPQPVDKAVFEQLLSPQLLVRPMSVKADATVHVPGSKSISNRVLLMAAMGEGEITISGLLQSDDTQVMISALSAMGAGPFHWDESGRFLTLRGLGGRFQVPKEPMYLGNAGTAARFLTTCATLILSPGSSSVLTGDKRMKVRPIKDLTDALSACGCSIKHLESPTSLPIEVAASGLAGGRIELSGKVSSQFVSSVLISAPYAQKPVELILPEPPVSQTYIDMTIKLMAVFGVKVEQEGTTVYRVPRKSYTNPKAHQVECDASSATYPLAIAAITGGTVTAEAVGANSIQGDAKFALLLKDMGCTIEQDADRTRVSGPSGGRRLKAVDVDMEPMTDAFMTAVALAAVAEGTTRITGIDNQRVKECNRIEVMVSELTKLGVPAGELPDGIWITGVDPETATLRPAVISCHNDHRIAMSFAVLGARIPQITIGQKSCVEKTYPEFWADMSRHLGMRYDAPPEMVSDAASVDADVQMPLPADERSVVLIGMRGAGKTHLGKAAAAHLGWDFIDLDHLYEARHGPIMQTVAAEGWSAFRERELAILKETLSTKSARTVIACGGGIVETAEARAVLRAHWPVVQARKPIADIEAYLGADASRPSLGEPPAVAYARRAPWYDECADFELLAAPGEVDWEAQERRFVRLLRRVQRADAAKAPHEHSFFISLTFPQINPDLLDPALFEDVDMVELRVDLLKSLEPNFIREQLALLRQRCELPVLFTVRSKSQGGAFEGSADQYLSLCEIAVSCCCEWVDLEADRDGAKLQAFCEHARRNCVQIIGSHHELGLMPTTEQIQEALRRCELQGAAALAKFVGVASDPLHALRVNTAASAAKLAIPHVALAMGNLGRMSRVLNLIMTPVTHPKLPVAAAPGQLSAQEIMTARKAFGYLPSRQFYLFGTPIEQSPSPVIHGTGFAANGCAHTYSKKDTASVDEVLEVMAMPNFGGASVTIPFKELLMPHVDSVSASVAAIGSLNTLTKSADGRISADNTDWQAIRTLLSRGLARRFAAAHVAAPERASMHGLVVGAGGTARAACYALQRMGVGTIHVSNRTADKASALAAAFGGVACADPLALPRLDLIVSCVPGAANFTLPDAFLSSQLPVVLDAAYIPRETPLLVSARRAGCVTFEGVEMLFEQGCVQCSIWTNRSAPRKKIVQALVTCLQQKNFGDVESFNDILEGRLQ